MLELTLFGMLTMYIVGIYVGKHWKEFTTE